MTEAFEAIRPAVAERSTDAGALLVHLRTNYVFAGDRSEPYSEADVPSPPEHLRDQS